jgi:hypothetical protein
MKSLRMTLIYNNFHERHSDSFPHLFPRFSLTGGKTVRPGPPCYTPYPTIPS